MKPSLRAESINHIDFRFQLRFYEDLVPKSLKDLEELRLRGIPEVLAQRRKDGNAFLERNEVTALVEWKLKHGTYRPNLAKLVAQNSVADIRKMTEAGFGIYEGDHNLAGKAVSSIAKLRGVGPATASLFLSCYDPIGVPFFSDELFRYLHFSDTKANGWDRKISYTTKEYQSMFDKTQVLRKRLETESGETVKAIHLEKMAYALGRSGEVKPTSIIGTAEGKRGVESVEEEDKELRPPSPKRRSEGLRRKQANVRSKRPTGLTEL